jgi:hypothetical protein
LPGSEPLNSSAPVLGDRRTTAEVVERYLVLGLAADRPLSGLVDH